MTSIVAIGNFDGVHLGHQALLAQLQAIATEKGLVPWVVLFEPQPLEFLRPKDAPARLTNAAEKRDLLECYGVSQVLVLPFDAAFSALSPHAFLSTLLTETLNASTVLVGADFRFGHKREGTVHTLQEAGFEVCIAGDVCVQGERVSSSRIRAALREGRFDRACENLGRPYTMQGTVIHGDKRGRALGFPTANIRIDRAVSPLHGVYVVRMHGVEKEPLEAVASIGTRPTVGGKEWLLEVHVLDREIDLYDRYVRVEFCHYCRDEIAYSTLDALVEQMKRDVAMARSYFSHESV